jgi:predicted MFS family arabinose efflux permease
MARPDLLTPSGHPAGAADRVGRRTAVGLGLLFGAIYFVQGVGEPTEGLIAQPVRSILKSWGHGDAAIATFVAVMAIPWSLKPLFGLLTDFVPLAGSRRKAYLVVANAAAAVGLGAVYMLPLSPGQGRELLAWLIVPTAGVALCDVAADALMIEKGQPLGLTGRLQSVQWACLYAATIAAGLVGGYLSEHRVERLGFLICAGLSALALVLTIACVREDHARARPNSGEARRTLGRLARSAALWRVGGFLFLWNFNPFSQTVLYLHMTRAMGLGEQFYGYTVSLLAAACVAASAGYGLYCRRVPMRTLVHASIALGVVATLAYAFLVDRRSALAITVAVGLTYMTATVIQLDLAARACPPEVAGTAFALLMALENLATITSTWLGGLLYEWGTARWGSRPAFVALVGVGAACTACCWLVMPPLPTPTRNRDGSGLDELVADQEGAGGNDRPSR